MTYRRLAIAGTGHIGGSVALAARRAGIATEIVGFDKNPAAAERAKALGIIDRITGSGEAAASDADLVVLATRIDDLARLGREAMRSMKPDGLLIDVGSVKEVVIRDVETAIDTPIRYVGCHPLAGTEGSGPEAARADLFEGRPCFICPGRLARPDVVEEAQALWTALGAVPIVVDAPTHDRFVAGRSHLPHAAAFALAAVIGADETPFGDAMKAIVPTSLRDTTRIAASDPALWVEIFHANRQALLPMLAQLRDTVGTIHDLVDKRQWPLLERVFVRGRQARRSWEPR